MPAEAAAPPAVDRVEVSGIDHAAEAPARRGRWQLAAALGLGVVAAGALTTPQPLAAAITDPVKPQQISLASRFGVSPAVIDSLSPASRAALETVPAEMRDMYRELPASGKKMIAENLGKSSRFLFVTVSHRNAFIRGNVAGFDVFSRIDSRLDQAIQHHEVNAAQATQMRQAIDMFRHLQVPQRRALVELMEAEQRLATHSPAPPARPADSHRTHPA